MVKPWLTIARNDCQVVLWDMMMVRPWSTIVDHAQIMVDHGLILNIPFGHGSTMVTMFFKWSDDLECGQPWSDHHHVPKDHLTIISGYGQPWFDGHGHMNSVMVFTDG